MTGFVPGGTLEEIQRRVSIVDLVSTYVRLKKQGRNYIGLCPFHAEKTPSFSVSPEKGLFHCFGCGAGGNVFTFLMRVEGLDFRSAVERLAEKVGVSLASSSEAPRRDRRNRAYELHGIAAEYFVAALRGAEGALARAYLEHRGISAETAACFGLGFCPAGSGLQQALASHGVPVAEATRWGLLGKRQGGGTYARFGGRLVFPIRNASGRIVGFAGRALGQQSPKYVNSPESEIFRKGELLFGLFEARHAIQSTRRVLVVEGYLDVLVLVQAGIQEVVATMGTAITQTQLETLRRVAEEVFVCFDGDDAGRRAAERAFVVGAKVGVWTRGVFLPAGEDPDSFVRAAGIREMENAMEKAVPLADFYFERKAPPPGASLPWKARAAREVGQVLAQVGDPVMARLLTQRAATLLGVEEHLLRSVAVAQNAPTAASKPELEETWALPEEKMLLAAMAVNRQVAQRVARELADSPLVSKDVAEVARRIGVAWQAASEPTAFIAELPEEVQATVSAYELGRGPLAGVDVLQVAGDCLAKLRRRQARTRLEQLRKELQAAGNEGDQSKIAELERQVRELRQILGT